MGAVPRKIKQAYRSQFARFVSQLMAVLDKCSIARLYMAYSYPKYRNEVLTTLQKCQQKHAAFSCIRPKPIRICY